MIAGGNIAASFSHGRHDVIQMAFDVVAAFGDDSFVNASGHAEIGIFLSELDHVAVGGHFKGAHIVAADFLVDLDHIAAVSIGINLKMDGSIGIQVPLFHIGVKLLIVGKEKFPHHIRRDQGAVVVADILAKEKLVKNQLFLMAGNHGVCQLKPGFHTIMDQIGIIVEKIQKILRTDQTSKIHITANHALDGGVSLGGSRFGFFNFSGSLFHSSGGGGIKSPFYIFFPGLPVLYRMIFVFGHKAVPAAFKIQDAPAGEVLYQFIISQILQNFFFKAREETGFAPAQAVYLIYRRLVVSEYLPQIFVIILYPVSRFEVTFFNPTIQHVVTKFLLIDGSVRADGVKITDLFCRRAHFFIIHKGIKIFLQVIYLLYYSTIYRIGKKTKKYYGINGEFYIIFGERSESMFVDFCKTGTPSVSPSVRLWTVYHLKADHSYRVCHRPFPTGKAVLVMTISGKGFLENQGFRYTLEPGSVLLFTPDQGEFFYHTAEEIWEFWWFEISEGHRLLKQNVVHSVTTDRLLTQMFEACLSSLRQGRKELASSMFLGIEAQLVHRVWQNTKRDEKQELFQKACEKIHQQLGTITVAQAAEEVGMGERELRTLFWNQGNCSPIQYITEAKMQMACFMLKNTSKSIGEISGDLGYSSQFYFSRVFKERFECRPSEWRNK